MQQLSLDNLRTLVTIIEQGGFAKAGELLGRAQPTISLQIKKLEQQLGKPLFHKVGQRQLANADGQALYEQAKQMLAINDQIFAQFRPSNLKGRLKLGIPSEFATTLLPGIIGEFNRLYPEVTLEVTSALSRNLLQQSHNEDFDLILALRDQAPEDDAELLLEDTLIWAGAPEFQQITQLTTLPLVLAPEGCIYRTRAINCLKQQTKAWRISYTNADLYGLVSAIQQGLGVTVLAKSSCPKELNVLTSKQLPALGTINICLWQGQSRHPQACETLAEFIKKRIKGL